MKWVLRSKLDDARAIVKIKVRLVAKGYKGEGINYGDIYAPERLSKLCKVLHL